MAGAGVGIASGQALGAENENDPRLLSFFLQNLVILAVLAGARAGMGPCQAPGADSEQDPRLLSSREFLRELGKGAGARKELSALSLRWINLRGLPLITAAFTYNK